VICSLVSTNPSCGIRVGFKLPSRSRIRATDCSSSQFSLKALTSLNVKCHFPGFDPESVEHELAISTMTPNVARRKVFIFAFIIIYCRTSKACHPLLGAPLQSGLGFSLSSDFYSGAVAGWSAPTCSTIWS
jgi:hypothetical protein